MNSSGSLRSHPPVPLALPVVPLLASDDRRLLQRCDRIDVVDADVRGLIGKLLGTMRAAPGIGLAAPQIGAFVRVCVIEIDGNALCMINPIIEHASIEMVRTPEGCLSFPGLTVSVPRHVEIGVAFTDHAGRRRYRMLDGLAAIAAQHEIDHLDGVLFHGRAYAAGIFDAAEDRRGSPSSGA